MVIRRESLLGLLRGCRRGAWLFALALLLAQVVAPGRHAAQAAPELLASAICAAGTAQPGGHQPDGDRPAMPECCLGLCQAGVDTLAPPPAAVALPVPLAVPRVRAPLAAGPLPAAVRLASAQPRGPPPRG